ncbi:MAG: 3'(2'),5'-bisphosphate nucleotidase CysQ [Rhodospirillaceae bacterium]|jgi:3'(2'), 5'-bisphosphate nucleotidase|nr:3'(2'),5'-bisphosphate nucleotidase CysQ [Rhodospirillaceae bacterium]MBT5895132.1 3'(2'),5'-bisphosphate nucleotidase CysQ [Rhodospirillaceae bacterium]MBT6431072.1 3'(2'),5'-bisphosphate nucleotidase CysQ [Rhodospirillaceae bacterium]MBT7756464.1 3'(2'),5'-bisphosphate nucleotidase CysQ [Rhodospirillaceae bacterium]
MTDSELAAAIEAIALQAGAAIMEIYARDFEVETKSDDSPVTEADQAAEVIIVTALRALTPEIPVVAEEEVAAGKQTDVGAGPFWLVDPLDGTREFISRNGDFTVNIALIRGGEPVLGTVHVPAKDETYTAAGPGQVTRQRGNGAVEAISARNPAGDGLVAMVSRSHASPETDDFLAELEIKERVDAGSSLKFCRLAEGAADLYPRLGRTMEWDTAAGHAVLACAGGSVSRLDGTPLLYGKDGFENPHFVARGRQG